MEKKISNKGFTLIELLIYLSIFGILMITITTFAFTFIEANTKSKIKKEISSAAYSVIKTISYEIKRANDIYEPTSILINHPGQLSLLTTYNIPVGEKIGYIDFYIDNDRLYLKREEQDAQVITSENIKVSELRFEHLSSFPDSVKIILTIEYNSVIPKYNYSYTLSSVANIRK